MRLASVRPSRVPSLPNVRGRCRCLTHRLPVTQCHVVMDVAVPSHIGWMRCTSMQGIISMSLPPTREIESWQLRFRPFSFHPDDQFLPIFGIAHFFLSGFSTMLFSPRPFDVRSGGWTLRPIGNSPQPSYGGNLSNPWHGAHQVSRPPFA